MSNMPAKMRQARPKNRRTAARFIIILWSWLLLSACAPVNTTSGPTVPPPAPATATPRPARTDIKLIPFDAVSREITFQSKDGIRLAGQIDSPPGVSQPPLVFIIHHSDPIDRDTYQYLAARLVPAGYAVFRFDKRGNGRSGGKYGCCEAEDALAAYQAALAAGGFAPDQVFIIAQSIGSRILADHYAEFRQIQPPAGVVLLSNLLENEEVQAIEAPLHLIVSDSEPRLAAIGPGAAAAYQAASGHKATFFVAPHTEHTLFDISTGPIDWSDPTWPEKFSEAAWHSLIDWLEIRRKQ